MCEYVRFVLVVMGIGNDDLTKSAIQTVTWHKKMPCFATTVFICGMFLVGRHNKVGNVLILPQETYDAT